jgi:hypothetical protein
MEFIEIQGRKYRPKTADELNGGDWRRMMLNFERALSSPEQLIPMMRAAVVIVCPTAAKDSRKWNDLWVIYGFVASKQHLAECLDAASLVMRRYADAGAAVGARLEELKKVLLPAQTV